MEPAPHETAPDAGAVLCGLRAAVPRGRDPGSHRLHVRRRPRRCAGTAPDLRRPSPRDCMGLQACSGKYAETRIVEAIRGYPRERRRKERPKMASCAVTSLALRLECAPEVGVSIALPALFLMTVGRKAVFQYMSRRVGFANREVLVTLYGSCGSNHPKPFEHHPHCISH